MSKYEQYLICKGLAGYEARGHVEERTIARSFRPDHLQCKYCGTFYRFVPSQKIVEENVPVPEGEPVPEEKSDVPCGIYGEALSYCYKCGSWHKVGSLAYPEKPVEMITRTFCVKCGGHNFDCEGEPGEDFVCPGCQRTPPGCGKCHPFVYPQGYQLALCAKCRTAPDEVEQIRERSREGNSVGVTLKNLTIAHDDRRTLLKKIDWLEFVISKLEIPKKKQEAECPEKF